MTQDEYEFYCPFRGALNLDMNERYTPNPWIFQEAHQPDSQQQKFYVIFRNFDRTRELTVTCDRDESAFKFSYAEKTVQPPHQGW